MDSEYRDSVRRLYVLSRRSSFSAFAFLPFTSSLSLSAVHHSVNTITASGMPSRNPLWVTSKLVTALPQRQPLVDVRKNRVRMRDVPEHLKDSALGLVHIAHQHPPTKAAIQNH